MNKCMLYVCGLFAASVCLQQETALCIEPQLRAPKFLPFHLAPERNWSGFYGNELPIAHVSGFDSNSFGSYLTIATGPFSTNAFGTQGASFTGLLLDDECKVEGPVAVAQERFSEIRERYQNQTKVLQTCIRIRVHDSTGIKPAENQIACEVKPISDYEAVAKGGVCYFMTVPGAAFDITYELDEDCAKRNFLNNIAFDPSDITAFSGYYISGDASGHSTNLLPLGATTLRLSREPSGKNFALSTNMGEGVPLWPARYETDFHMGSIDINVSNESASLTSSLIINNTCPKKCASGVCESPCDFSTAVGAQISLFELKTNSHASLLDIWYSGLQAPAQWLGMSRSTRFHNYPVFQVGKRYRISADLSYLTIFHQLYKEGFKQLLVDTGILRSDPTQPTRPLPPIGVLDTIKSLAQVPRVPQFSLLGDNGVLDYSLTLNALRSLIELIGWPPYYTEACHNSHCVPTSRGLAKTLVGADFSIESISADGVAKLKNIEVWRDSSVANSYKIETQKLPAIRCR